METKKNQKKQASTAPKAKDIGVNEEKSSKNSTHESFEDDKGYKYGFSDRTPTSFRFNGIVKTQEEWLKDQDAMEMLVFGNCTYIKKIKN
ncbi:hypothetical protein T190115A13A_160027 [Tenacibaculum sp. 190524A02b]|uniref:Uncharacterized protein n=1 Tax=Tenacibaculum vairaonense TaxID=3137860 RepID=A0ABP1FAW6_9FLAO